MGSCVRLTVRKLPSAYRLQLNKSLSQGLFFSIVFVVKDSPDFINPNMVELLRGNYILQGSNVAL
ncbi:hypothetical protein BIW11_04384 [Tropilaelaps mercedesae]|uniref:Uncharacterized protein n=1 Tax=Tropilaelaps mercedesae TaxID=418985 RepID=A0A1V9X7V7_9ACAR|nr:hypothetical protein BIW11_04384 [Tropilaelaps mercedesae]